VSAGPADVDGRVKGWPDHGCAAGDVSRAGLHIADLPTPALVLREESLAHNIAAMATWCAREGILLAPHGKTTMAPRLFARQLDAGAWGITVATVQQARVAVAAGVARILIANQLADPAELRWVAEQAAEVLFLVDSLAGVELARTSLQGAAPVDVLLEVGYAGGRGGARSMEDALAVARAVAAVPELRLAGVEAFEGLLTTVADVDALLERVAAVARTAADGGLLEDEPLISAGGSQFYDRVAAILKPVAAAIGGRLLLRSGCYITHDHGLYARQAPGDDRLPGGPRFEPAIEVRARVLSRPEPGRAILGAGKRDLAYDVDLPVRLDGPGRVVALNDQHAHLELPAEAPLAVGDIVRLGVSHPCTALERWRLIPLVDGRGRVIDALATWF
jgi:D-serine deaminase-like pyridoxal phosphate-dependent protein